MPGLPRANGVGCHRSACVLSPLMRPSESITMRLKHANPVSGRCLGWGSLEFPGGGDDDRLIAVARWEVPTAANCAVEST
jgi:hypothetical protein